MLISMNQYISNPFLSSVINASAREIMKAQYQKRFDQLMVRENGKVEYYLYTDKEHDTYWAYFKIPSESVQKFYYDVLFKFTPSQSTGIFEDLFKYNVKFFSNDPSFVYTFAYSFKQNEIFIDELSSKMSKQALTDAAKEKNPKNDIGYEKAIYFAYIVMRDRGLNKIIKFKGEAKPLDKKFLMDSIMNADEKVALRSQHKSNYKTKKKNVINSATAAGIEKAIGSKIDFSTTKMSVVGNVKKVNRITNGVKTTRTTKTTKKK